MRSRSNRRFSLRLRRRRSGLLCRLVLPAFTALPDGLAREFVLIASLTAPHLRRLTVYRCLRGAQDEPPRAA